MAHLNAQASLLIYPLLPITILDKRNYSLDLLNQGPPRLSVYKPANTATFADLCHKNSYFIVVLVIKLTTVLPTSRTRLLTPPQPPTFTMHPTVNGYWKGAITHERKKGYS